MPYYTPIKGIPDLITQKRIVSNLLELRKKISAEVPARTAKETLLLATWNIREFGDNRSQESLYYMAEIIEAFDLVAIQEVLSNLKGLQNLISLLGKNWDYIVTDATDGSAGGGERMAFLFDTNKVKFRNIAGEIVLPDNLRLDGDLQFARTPFTAAFQAGWFKFSLCTVHIFYGEDSPTSAGMKRRVDEIDAVAKWFQKKAKNENASYILLGDFNIIDPTHTTMKALEQNKFYIPDQLKTKPTDLGQTKHYDQIAFKIKEDEDMLIFDRANGKAGSFKFQDVVYKNDEMAVYRDKFEEKNTQGKTEDAINKYYLSKWRTFQMSDHIPLWVELHIDFSNEYLEKIEAGE